MATVLKVGLAALAAQAIGYFSAPAIAPPAAWQYLFLDASNAEENPEHVLTDFTEIATGGGGRKLATLSVEEVLAGASYKSVLSANWTFTGTLTVNGVVMVNSAGGDCVPLMRHLWPAPKNVVKDDTLAVIVKMDNRRTA